MKNIKERTIEIINAEYENNKARRNESLSMLNRVLVYSKKINKDVEMFEKKDFADLISSIKTRSKSGHSNYICIVNKLTNIMGLNIEKIQRKDLNVEKIEDTLDETGTLNRIYNRDEIIDICNVLNNPQDKFIIYGLFSGVSDIEYLLNLKSKDIDLEKGLINTPDRVIEMDEYMKDICTDMLDFEFGSIYYCYIDENAPKGNRAMKQYDLNWESEYAIKTKPLSYTGNGLLPMKYNGVKTKFVKIRDVIGKHQFSVGDVMRSGVIYRISLVKDKWTVAEIEQYLKETNYKLQGNETYRLYNMKYSAKNMSKFN